MLPQNLELTFKFLNILIFNFADSRGVTPSLAREHSSLFGVEQD